jgi:hypothetical protein
VEQPLESMKEICMFHQKGDMLKRLGEGQIKGNNY